MGQLTPIEDHRDLKDRVDKLEGARGDKAMSKTTDTTLVHFPADIKPSDQPREAEHRLTKAEYRRFCDRLASLDSRFIVHAGNATESGHQPLPRPAWIGPGPNIIKTQVKQALDEWDEEKARDEGKDDAYDATILVLGDAIARHGLLEFRGDNQTMAECVVAALDQAKCLIEKNDRLDAENRNDQEATIAALGEQIAQFEATLGGKTTKRLLKACKEYAIDVEPEDDLVRAVFAHVDSLLSEQARLLAEARKHDGGGEFETLKAKNAALLGENEALTKEADVQQDSNEILSKETARLRFLRAKEGENADGLLAQIKRLQDKMKPSVLTAEISTLREQRDELFDANKAFAEESGRAGKEIDALKVENDELREQNKSLLAAAQLDALVDMCLCAKCSIEGACEEKKATA